ncbi:MAG: DUF2812 domain-containing protein [Firmicutes bacterium]|nr:DUF2812 domain-containing protein [Bacillota bacterium]
MGKIKHVFRRYANSDCDAMALYLEQMAAKGWHFRGWGFGMEFEEGEPSEVRYDVQVFNNNSESQIKPDDDTFEYAAYCEAAGWTLVDSMGKLVVFRALEKNAEPIVTKEEKFRNIRKAWFATTFMMLGSLIIILLYGSNFLGMRYPSRFFDPVLGTFYVGLILMYAGYILRWLYDGFQVLRCWNVLRSGGTPFYGYMSIFNPEKPVDSNFGLIYLLTAIVLYASVYSVINIPKMKGGIDDVSVMIMIVGIMSLFWIFNRYFRAAGKGSVLISICAMVLTFALLMGVVYNSERLINEKKRGDTPPDPSAYSYPHVLKNDLFGDIEYETISAPYFDSGKSFLVSGYHESGMANIRKETEEFNYEYYEFRFEAMARYLCKQRLRKRSYTDVSAECGIDYAVVVTEKSECPVYIFREDNVAAVYSAYKGELSADELRDIGSKLREKAAEAGR